MDNANIERLRRLSSESQKFTALDGGALKDPQQRQKMLANFMAPQTLELRVDAQVMLIKNSDDLLVNGSLGRVVRFVDPAIYSTDLDKEAMPGEVGVIGALTTTTGVGSAIRRSGSASVATQLYPVVEFISARGSNRRMLIMPDIWKVESDGGEVQVSRTQVSTTLVLRTELDAEIVLAPFNSCMGDEYT